MRIALVVGINYYENCSALFGCVDDAKAVGAVLGRHGDGSINFDCKLDFSHHFAAEDVKNKG